MVDLAPWAPGSALCSSFFRARRWRRGFNRRHHAGKQKGIAVFFEVFHILDAQVARAAWDLLHSATPWQLVPGSCFGCKAPSDICRHLPRSVSLWAGAFPRLHSQRPSQEFWFQFLCSFLSRKMPFTFKEQSWGLTWAPEIGSCCGATLLWPQPSALARQGRRPPCPRRGGSGPGQTPAAPGGCLWLRCMSQAPVGADALCLPAGVTSALSGCGAVMSPSPASGSNGQACRRCPAAREGG